MKKKEIKVGDKIRYRGNFGSGKLETVTILHIEKCGDGEKYGEPVESIEDYTKQPCVLDLDDNHWCYGDQIVSVL